MNAQLSPQLFDDLRPLEKRSRATVVVVTNDRIVPVHRVLARDGLELCGSDVRKAVLENHPSATCVKRGLVLDEDTLVPHPGNYNPHGHRSRVCDDAGFWWQITGRNGEGRKMLNGFPKILGTLRYYWTEGKVWGVWRNGRHDHVGTLMDHAEFSLR